MRRHNALVKDRSSHLLNDITTHIHLYIHVCIHVHISVNIESVVHVYVIAQCTCIHVYAGSTLHLVYELLLRVPHAVVQSDVLLNHVDLVLGKLGGTVDHLCEETLRQNIDREHGGTRRSLTYGGGGGRRIHEGKRERRDEDPSKLKIVKGL